MDWLHCCTFVLGGNCEHIHKEIFCIKCLTCFSFFKRNFSPFLKISMKKYLQITRMKFNHDGYGAKAIICGLTLCSTSSTFQCSVFCYRNNYAVNENRFIHHLYGSRPHTKVCRWDIGRFRLIIMIKKACVCWDLWRYGGKLMGKAVDLNINFWFFLIKGYSGQDHVQVAYLIKLAVDTMQDHHPSAKKSSFG